MKPVVNVSTNFAMNLDECGFVELEEELGIIRTDPIDPQGVETSSKFDRLSIFAVDSDKA